MMLGVRPAFGLVIFDCDGVLVDSERITLRIGRTGLARHGWEMTDEEIVERFVGRSNADVCADIAARLGAEIAKLWDVLYQRALEQELIAVDGITDALDRISLPMCVASNSGHGHIERVLRKTGLNERFAGCVYSASEVEHGKPAPDLFLHAASRMGVDAAACVVIEDSVPGVLAAQAAGMTVFAYAGGATLARRLAETGARTFLDMRELPELLTNPPLHTREESDPT